MTTFAVTSVVASHLQSATGSLTVDVNGVTLYVPGVHQPLALSYSDITPVWLPVDPRLPSCPGLGVHGDYVPVDVTLGVAIGAFGYTVAFTASSIAASTIAGHLARSRQPREPAPAPVRVDDDCRRFAQLAGMDAGECAAAFGHPQPPPATVAPRRRAREDLADLGTNARLPTKRRDDFASNGNPGNPAGF